MKYIDAGTTAEKISNEFEIPMSELCDVFADIPAADVQPVKHAKWIEAQDKHGSYFMCSNCGTAEKIESDQGGTVWRHDEYCRKCGARMDGDTNG